jgi:hypothetical protein
MVEMVKTERLAEMAEMGRLGQEQRDHETE